MKAPFKWEQIECNEDSQTFRAKVEGGWLVNHVVNPCNQESLMRMTTTFVPDTQHNWIVDNTPPPSHPDQVIDAMTAGNSGADDFSMRGKL